MRLLLLVSSIFIFSCSTGLTQTGNNQNPGLPSGTLEDAGFNRDSIETLIEALRAPVHKDFRGLVVIKNNQVVIEEYFNTFWEISINDIRSAGKSITAMLLGIAIKDGLVKNLDQNLYSFFPKDKYPKINEDYKKIKLIDLVNMTSGLHADTDDINTPGHSVHWMPKDNWKDYILNVPLKNKPGKKWFYADINPLLIAAVIEEKSGMSLKDYAQKKLFDPLGIKQFYWFTNASNQTGAAGNLYLTALDFAKLGLLIANEGKWKGTQIIDSDYVEKIVNTKSPAIADYFFLADSYGLFWYKTERTFGNKKVDYLFASGNGGNQLIVIPEEEMVIALSSSAYGQPSAHRRSYKIFRKIMISMK